MHFNWIIRLKVNKLEITPFNLQLVIYRRGWSHGDINMMHRFKNELNMLNDQEKSCAKQKARIQWLNFGDDNTTLFHKAITQRYNRNFFCNLRDIQENTISIPKLISQTIEAHFKELFDANINSPLGNLDEIRQFLEPNITYENNTEVSREELKQFFWNIHFIKVSGSNGLNGEFYRDTWIIVGEDVTDAVTEFFLQIAYLENSILQQ